MLQQLCYAMAASALPFRLSPLIINYRRNKRLKLPKGFLAVLRAYLDSPCSDLCSHTITNVQSNDEKVSLLLKERSLIHSLAMIMHL
ncbi:hypothetical protein Nepgr_005949 [Nepenthes gracilis]|uniref:Uncharacterized protein n=1 Tax=Nepenthes gracilis TaxID=150966 RepID=A0AAD3XGX7_NEPGR|nr:hypothetical protein Nepgr_005949 [Nepenthes gracilis]